MLTCLAVGVDTAASIPTDLAQNAANSRSSPSGCLGLRHFDLATLWPTELVRVENLCVTNVGDARIVVEILDGDPIRNL